MLPFRLPTIDFDFNGDGSLDGVEVFFLNIVILAAVVTALGVLWALFRKVNTFVKRANLFWDDWAGKDAADGHEATDGVIAKIRNMESSQTTMLVNVEAVREEQRDVAAQLLATTVELPTIKGNVQAIKDKVDYELSPNRGGSTKDMAVKGAALAPLVQEMDKKLDAQIEWTKAQVKRIDALEGES